MRLPTFRDSTAALWLGSSFQRPLNDGQVSSALRSHSLASPIELPGGTPLSLCEASRSTDLFNISSVELTQQPVFINDDFLLHIYGSFQKTFSSNATLNLSINCGSHCDDYGVPPDERAGASLSGDFCTFTDIEQPSGGKKKEVRCPPEEGYALITEPGYVWPGFWRSPGWYNFTLDVQTDEGDRVFCLTGEVCLRWEDDKKNEQQSTGPWGNCTWPR